MKAAVVVSHGVLELRDDILKPVPGPREALVRVEACGLCGTTDRHIVEGRQAHHPADQYPAVLGHEAVGTVTEVGAEVTRFKIGDRVTRPCSIWPGTKSGPYFSAWGGFAEYGIVREPAAGQPDDYQTARQQVVPPGLSVEDAVLAISVAEVAGWMQKVAAKAGGLDGRSVVIGGSGFAACVMAQCAAAAGCQTIIAVGRNPQKLEKMRENGATHSLEFGARLPSEVRDLTGGGADLFLDAAGHQDVFAAGLQCLCNGGEAAIYGAPEGFSYAMHLGAVGGDFSVHYFTPPDDTFFPEACRRIGDGTIKASLLRSHVWNGLESLPQALQEQSAGEVLKGLITIP